MEGFSVVSLERARPVEGIPYLGVQVVEQAPVAWDPKAYAGVDFLIGRGED